MTGEEVVGTLVEVETLGLLDSKVLGDSLMEGETLALKELEVLVDTLLEGETLELSDRDRD